MPVTVPGVTTGIDWLMVIVIDAGAEVPNEFVARMASVLVPRVVGVPVINPVVEFSVSPTGRMPLATA